MAHSQNSLGTQIMTDHEHGAELRALFDDVDLSLYQTSLDLIGPAVSLCRSRRRIDRFAAIGGVGALATAAVIGAAALSGGTAGSAGAVRPGGSGGAAVVTSSPATNRTPTYTKDTFKGLSAAETSAQIKATFAQMLPAGYSMTFAEERLGLPIRTFVGLLTGPKGSAFAQFNANTQVGVPAPVDESSFAVHQATAQNPTVSGNVTVTGGAVKITAEDYKADYLYEHGALSQTDATKIVGNVTNYDFLPTGPTPHARYLSLTTLTTDPPLANGNSLTQLKQNDGYCPTGPIMTPDEFATLAASPEWPKLDALLQHAHDLPTTAPNR